MHGLDYIVKRFLPVGATLEECITDPQNYDTVDYGLGCAMLVWF